MLLRTSVLFLLAATSVVPAAEPDPAVARVKKDLEFLASDECQGRGLKTKGLVKAGDYIASAFKESGLKPAFENGSYFQPFTANGPGKAVNPIALAFKTDAGKMELEYGKTFVATDASGTAKLPAAGLVFVGYGISAPDKKYDDYAGVDVKGKIVVVLRKMPRADAKENRFAGPNAPEQSLTYKIETAGQKGAAGILFVNDRGTAAKTDDLMEPKRTAGSPSDGPVFQIKRDIADDLLAGAGTSLAKIEDAIDKDLKPNSFELKGWTCGIEVQAERPKYQVRNVVGVVPGAGPLANETVVIGAHYDHLGAGDEGGTFDNKSTGKTHFGADDNASGTSGLLELARRFGAKKDRQGRRVVFVAFSGEEMGLFGSAHYVKNPPFPLDTTAFMINLDMIGRMIQSEDKDAGNRKRDRLAVYGSGTAEGLDKFITDTNAKFDMKLLRVPGGVGPSDHTSFYLKKIPVLFLFTGTHPDYHRVTDTADKINVPGLLRVADLTETYATHFATVKDRPKYLPTQGGDEDPTDPNAKPGVSRRDIPTIGIMPGNYGEDGGVLVGGTRPGGPAEKAGIREGDLIVEMAGKPVKNMNGYMTILGGIESGKTIDVIVMRKDQKVPLKVTPVK